MPLSIPLTDLMIDGGDLTVAYFEDDTDGAESISYTAPANYEAHIPEIFVSGRNTDTSPHYAYLRIYNDSAVQQQQTTIWFPAESVHNFQLPFNPPLRLPDGYYIAVFSSDSSTRIFIAGRALERVV